MSIFTRWVGRNRRDEGQTLVELGLLLPVLLLIVMGIIEFGWVFMGYLDMVHASREGIRYASIFPDQTDDIRQKIQDSTGRFNVELKDAVGFYPADGSWPGSGEMWIYVDVPSYDPGDPVTIRVKAGIGFLTSFLRSITGVSVFRAHTEAVMSIE